MLTLGFAIAALIVEASGASECFAGRAALPSPSASAFRRIRDAHSVWFHRTGLKRFRHLVGGDLALAFEALNLHRRPTADISYTAEPRAPMTG